MVPTWLAKRQIRSQSIECVKTPEPAAHAPEDGFRADPHVLEDQLAEGRGAQAHLLEALADPKPGAVVSTRKAVTPP